MNIDSVVTAIGYVGAGFVLVGLLFVLVGVGSFVAESPPTEYDHSISSVEESPSEVPSDREDQYGTTTQSPDGVLRYANLSDRGQDVFDRTRRAYEANGSDYTLGPGRTPPSDFDYYTDSVSWGDGRYYVAYEGQYYRFSTSQSQPSGFGDNLLGLVLVSFGIAPVGFGVLGLCGYALWRRGGD